MPAIKPCKVTVKFQLVKYVYYILQMKPVCLASIWLLREMLLNGRWFSPTASSNTQLPVYVFLQALVSLSIQNPDLAYFVLQKFMMCFCIYKCITICTYTEN